MLKQTKQATYDPATNFNDQMKDAPDASDNSDDSSGGYGNDFGVALLNAIVSGIKDNQDNTPSTTPDTTIPVQPQQNPIGDLIGSNYNNILLQSMLHFGVPDNQSATPDYNATINAILNQPVANSPANNPVAIPEGTTDVPASNPLPQAQAVAPQQTSPVVSPIQQQSQQEIANPTPVNATSVAPVIPTPQPLAPTGTVLQGSGMHTWTAAVDGHDIVAQGLATVFGGGNDNQDPSNQAKAGVLGVSLPTGQNMGTSHSPFPTLPPGTMVRVTNPANGKSIVCPVIDEGPVITDTNSTGVLGSSMVDMTPAVAQALGTDPDPNNSDAVTMQIRIIGGANYITPDNVKSTIDSKILPSDWSTISKLGDAIYSGNKINVNAVDDLSGQLQSGAFRKYAYLLGGYADNLQNNNGDQNQINEATQGIKSVYNKLHSLWMNR